MNQSMVTIKSKLKVVCGSRLVHARYLVKVFAAEFWEWILKIVIEHQKLTNDRRWSNSGRGIFMSILILLTKMLIFTRAEFNDGVNNRIDRNYRFDKIYSKRLNIL